MKKNMMGHAFKTMLLAVVFLSAGCVSKVPPLSAVLSPPLPDNVVSTFENGSTKMNPTLLNCPNGTWLDNTYPSYNIINSIFVTPNTVANSVDNSNYAIHIYGTLTDKGDGTYPAFELEGLFGTQASPYFDATSFAGVSFQMDIPNDDTCKERLFGIGTDQTVGGIAGGHCLSNCNDDFWMDNGSAGYTTYSGFTPTGSWINFGFTWSQLKQEGWGTAASPAGLANHLSKMILLFWKFDANNAAGTYYVDFWVDNIQFY